MWHSIESEMWSVLEQFDFADTCNSARTCPCRPDPSSTNEPAFVGNASSQCTRSLTGPGVCGGISRVWFRMIFHDAGTFNKSDGTGGMDGSLQFELDRAENPFAASIAFYRNLHLSHGGRAGMADLVVLGAYVGFHRCQGPLMPFSPGRVDAAVANKEGMLPGVTEDRTAILAKFERMGFNATETVALIGAGHTVSQLQGRKLDSTPHKYDVNFFAELLKGPPPSASLASDRALAAPNAPNTPNTRAVMSGFASSFTAFNQAVVAALDKLAWLGQTKP